MDKSKILEALKLIKSAFSVAVKFTEEKLKDGVTIISYEAEDLAIGVPVMVITEQGKITLPDGDYETIDGDTFTITNGNVSECVLVPAEQEVAPPNNDAPSPAQAMTDAQAKSIIESIVTERHFATEIFVSEKFEALTKLISDNEDLKSVNENFATQKTETEKELKELKEKYEGLQTQFTKALELIEKIAELPSATPAEQTPTKTKFNLREHQTAFKKDLESIFENSNK